MNFLEERKEKALECEQKDDGCLCRFADIRTEKQFILITQDHLDMVLKKMRDNKVGVDPNDC